MNTLEQPFPIQERRINPPERRLHISGERIGRRVNQDPRLKGTLAIDITYGLDDISPADKSIDMAFGSLGDVASSRDFSEEALSIDPPVTELVEAQGVEAQGDKDSLKSNDNESKPSWLRKNMLKLSLGAAGVGLAVGLATDGPKETWDNFAEDAPWAAAGVATTEAMWIGGGVLMLGAAGRRVGNPLKVRDRWEEIKTAPANNPAFKLGLAINTAGALGSAAVVTAGSVAALPPESWPAPFIWAAGDIMQTVGTRAAVYSGVKKLEESGERTKQVKPVVRTAREEDIDRLADIDLALFSKAYGEELPSKESVVDMLSERYKNCPDWMFVAEMDGEVRGFVSAFPTDVPLEEFHSWEQSTANGTLDGKVKEDGKYVYVTNMTIHHDAVVSGAREMLLANLFANAIEHGAEYGYFESRVPLFRGWLNRQIKKGEMIEPDEEALQEVAEQYMNLRRDDGKRYDAQLRMYEKLGYELARVVPNAFNDDASLNFGVVCKADVPPANSAVKNIKPVRNIMANGLRAVAKSPTLIQKVL